MQGEPCKIYFHNNSLYYFLWHSARQIFLEKNMLFSSENFTFRGKVIIIIKMDNYGYKT